MIRSSLEEESGDTQLIDTTPSSAFGQVSDSSFSVLEEGKTFSDNSVGLSITTLEVNDNFLRIRVNYDASIRCSSDLQCNDNNPGTTDVCTDSGTVRSNCEYTPQCDDGIDNDGDGEIDYGSKYIDGFDEQCYGPLDLYENLIPDCGDEFILENKEGKAIFYSLTSEGRRALKISKERFVRTFTDIFD